MDINEIFRSFFGFHNPRHPNVPDYGDHIEHEEGCPYHSEEAPNFFSFSGVGFGHIFAHFHEMQRQMEEIDQQMQNIFSHSEETEFPDPFSPLNPPEMDPKYRNPRNEMLKPGAGTDAPVPRSPDNPDKPNFGHIPRIPSPWSIFSIKERRPERLEDKDLDKEIHNPDDAAKLFDDNSPPNHFSMEPYHGNRGPQRFSFQKSMSVTRRSHNGKVEEHRTVVDTQGNEESTVTRSLGDKSYTITTKTDKSGVQEKIENYQNMDETERSEFDQKWNSNAILPKALESNTPEFSQPGNDMLKTQDSQSNRGSLLLRIFGFDPFRK